MLSKKDLLEKCKDLQRQICSLQDQINTLRSEQITADVVDAEGKIIKIPSGFSTGFYHDGYTKTRTITTKEAIEAILSRLDMELKVRDDVPAKAVVMKKE
jgi:hypothetical protein